MYFGLCRCGIFPSMASPHGHFFAVTKIVLYFRNSHPHGSHYNPIMQQPALLTGHVTLPSNQTLNVGVAHVMRQPTTNNNSSSKKSKPHQMSSRYSDVQVILDSLLKKKKPPPRVIAFIFILIFVFLSGTCRPTRCRPLRWCCRRSAPSG